MRLVLENEYDQNEDGGDGNLTQATRHVDASATRVTQYRYDWRNRREYEILDEDDQGAGGLRQELLQQLRPAHQGRAVLRSGRGRPRLEQLGGSRRADRPVGDVL